VVLIALQAFFVTAPKLVFAGPMQFMFLFWAPVLTVLLLMVWWVFASRLRWADRLLGVAAFLAAAGAAVALTDPSFRFFGLLIYALPAATTAWVAWLVLSQLLPWPVRRAGLLVVFVLAWGWCPMVRMNGVTGGLEAEVAWRWSPTAEDRFLADLPAGEAAADAAKGPPVRLQQGDWPRFRGPMCDGRLTGVRIATDWEASPPQPLWRRRVGPGWSSFTVVDGRAFTQEQRGEDEAVVCCDADTGKQRWVHADKVRFTELVSGAGPRATPTFADGKLYTLGANGTLNCLDAGTGRRKWSADVRSDSGADKPPQWGYSSSPLVWHGLVTVVAGGKAKDGEPAKRLLAYDADTGSLAWAVGAGGHTYCSAQQAKVAGVEQILVSTEVGLTAYHPRTGKQLWEHEWSEGDAISRVVQPAVVGDADVLLGTPFNHGTRRVRLSETGGKWSDEVVWHTKAVSPYFNDLVLHEGFLYGSDGAFFTCVDLKDGKKRWRVRAHPNAQVLLLADQGVLLVLSEKGEAALVKADPERHAVLGRFQALEGKTWNHPVVAGGKLFVRNAEEAACYPLRLAK
jgi:outer membrane protein assembly factor BamB